MLSCNTSSQHRAALLCGQKERHRARDDGEQKEAVVGKSGIAMVDSLSAINNFLYVAFVFVFSLKHATGPVRRLPRVVPSG